ncbi:hypothetical protein PTKIN_Ptkin07bG0277600 [Pterospermum kingtungense]
MLSMGARVNYPNRMILLMDFGSPFSTLCCFKKGCHDHFVEMARTVLLKHIPLEEDMKISPIYVCVTHGPRFGKLGSFANEVFELVDIAEIRRRFLSHRFISKYHILWAVRLTEFKDFVDRLVEDIGLRVWVEKPATCPPYSIYILARATADIHGAEVVGVEHIVVATIFKMMLGKDLNEFNNIHRVKMFLEAVRGYKKKSDVQEGLDKVDTGEEEHLDNRSSDISLNAEVGDEDDESDIATEIDDYSLEFVKKNKIKDLRRSKKYRNYKWSRSIYSKRTVL